MSLFSKYSTPYSAWVRSFCVLVSCGENVAGVQPCPPAARRPAYSGRNACAAVSMSTMSSVGYHRLPGTETLPRKKLPSEYNSAYWLLYWSSQANWLPPSHEP